MCALPYILMLVTRALVRRVPTQATSIIEPPKNHDFRITQQWDGDSRPGMLSQRAMGSDNVNLHVQGALASRERAAS